MTNVTSQPATKPVTMTTSTASQPGPMRHQRAKSQISDMSKLSVKDTPSSKPVTVPVHGAKSSVPRLDLSELRHSDSDGLEDLVVVKTNIHNSSSDETSGEFIILYC